MLELSFPTQGTSDSRAGITGGGDHSAGPQSDLEDEERLPRGGGGVIHICYYLRGKIYPNKELFSWFKSQGSFAPQQTPCVFLPPSPSMSTPALSPFPEFSQGDRVYERHNHLYLSVSRSGG